MRERARELSVSTKHRDIKAGETLERKMLLKRCFPKGRLSDIGRAMDIQYFTSLPSSWTADWDEATYKIAISVSDDQLRDFFKNFNPYQWQTFYGQYYTYTKGRFLLEGSWDLIQTHLQELKLRHGRALNQLLRSLLEDSGGESIENLEERMKLLGYRCERQHITDMVKKLENAKVLTVVYEGSGYREWSIREELMPLIRAATTGRPISKPPTAKAAAESFPPAVQPPLPEELDVLREELEQIGRMDREFDDYLSELLKSRLRETISFGKEMSAVYLAEYLKANFGPVLYFDSFLAIAQQYGLADVEIAHHHGKTGFRTGFNLALFGEPGTGKSFSTRDLIIGSGKVKLPAQGLPGRNRYAGGITPARFIRIGQAYEGKTLNFIVPEFNDWFKYKGMVEPLKLAMERGQIQYETAKEAIGPYRFSSFFTVNYNTAVHGNSYETTVSDPNFEAIEDRVLCRLHRLTKERFVEIAKSRRKLAFGEMSIPAEAGRIRDHLTLVHAIETKHPLVKDQFKYKPVILTQETYGRIEETRNAILERISGDSMRFSARLEGRAICLAGALALPSYFQAEKDYIPIGEEALEMAVRFYVEEASVRSRGAFAPHEILK